MKFAKSVFLFKVIVYLAGRNTVYKCLNYLKKILMSIQDFK